MNLALQMVLALVAHDIGDYLLQSDWQANEKTKAWLPALVHASLYTLCFVAITRDARALGIIGATHLAIDHWRLARYVCWAKNFIAPRHPWWHPWSECSGTGYHKARPPWMAVWLMIRADNTMHHMCNLFALWLVS